MRDAEKRTRRPRLNAVAAAAVLLFAVMLTSCEPELSVHRLYTDADLVFDPNLIGTWVPPDSDAKVDVGEIRIAAGRLNQYVLTVTVEDNGHATTVVFAAHLVKLHGRLFLDLAQLQVDDDGKESETGFVIPGHMFGRVAIDGDSLTMSFLDDEWVKSHLASHELSLDWEAEDIGPVVLTAPTADLQIFVVDHADDDEAFSYTVDGLTRKEINAD